MAIFIYSFIFASTFIWVYFLIGTAFPFGVTYYKQWQTRKAGEMSSHLERSFIFVEKQREILLTLFPIGFAILGGVIVRKPLALVIGFLVGLMLPSLLIKVAWQNRIKKFRGQLVDSIMILSSCLKAGYSLFQAIEVLCDEMPPPVSQEFGLVLKENKLGVSLEESLRLLRKRIPLEEMNLLISSILVAKETGGELTKVFSRLTETIRNNLKLKEKISTLTLQGRLQGAIMAFLPIGFAWFIYQQNPHHFDVMLETQMGKSLLVGAVLSQLIGMYLIKKISTIKV